MPRHRSRNFLLILFSMADLTAANIEVLRLLNRYRFLTNPQLLRLGLVILSRFGDGNRPYIGKKDFGFIAGVGRLHRIYYLQKRGAQLLAETLHLDDDEVSYQKVKPPFLQDYFHRLATIDVHIELDRFAAQYGARCGSSIPTSMPTAPTAAPRPAIGCGG
jgi:hypothetical protein